MIFLKDEQAYLRPESISHRESGLRGNRKQVEVRW